MNPFGFHLSDGTLQHYLNGREYRDVYGAWDWNLIPGTTVDYGATPLACNQVQFKGNESFVGGVALGGAGIGVMNYTNPMTGSLHWSKNYFFFPGTYAVQFAGGVVSSSSAPVLTTLDQRQLSGPVVLDGKVVVQEKVNLTASTVWHDRVGFRFQKPVQLILDLSTRTSSWESIGVSLGNESQTLLSAAFHQPDEEDVSYVVELDVEDEEFQVGSSKIDLFRSKELDKAYYGASFGAVEGSGERMVGLAFWSFGEFETGLEDIRRVKVSDPALILFQRKESLDGWRVAVSDPTQNLTQLQMSVLVGTEEEPREFVLELPQDLLAGSSEVFEFNI